MSTPLSRRIRRKANRLLTAATPRVGWLSHYRVEGQFCGGLWLYPNERYLFIPVAGEPRRGHWHHIDGALLVFDHYVMTADHGRTFYSSRIHLRLVQHRVEPDWPNCNPFFYDPARAAYDVPKLKDRLRLLAELPHDAVIAEIGVETGAYSHTIMELTSPRRFHLIDGWEQIPDPWPSFDQQRENRLAVERMFAREIEAGRVVIHTGDDVAIIRDLPDDYFDWVYIDTSHQYEHTLRELEAIAPKMKPTGLICGHDYADSTTSRRYGWGVIRAVNEFLRNHPWRYRFLTDEESASFVLERQ